VRQKYPGTKPCWCYVFCNQIFSSYKFCNPVSHNGFHDSTYHRCHWDWTVIAWVRFAAFFEYWWYNWIFYPWGNLPSLKEHSNSKDSGLTIKLLWIWPPLNLTDCLLLPHLLLPNVSSFFLKSIHAFLTNKSTNKLKLKLKFDTDYYTTSNNVKPYESDLGVTVHLSVISSSTNMYWKTYSMTD